MNEEPVWIRKMRDIIADWEQEQQKEEKQNARNKTEHA